MAIGMGTYIRLSKVQRTQPIYRIVGVDRVYELFETRQNVLVTPDKWDDPFENFILRSGRIPRQNWFGQCWTRHRASDAVWRIYSRDSRGVRIRSSPARLVESLCESLQSGCLGFVGVVQYLAQKRLMKFAQAAIRPGKLHDPVEAAETLLVKRPAFRHEAEIRLLLLNPTIAASQKEVRYPVDPHVLIDELMLDPRMSRLEAEKLKGEIKARTGFGGPIKRSLLYAPPKVLDDDATVSGRLNTAG